MSTETDNKGTKHMSPTETATLYLALTETDYTAAIALAHEYEDKATPDQFAEYLDALFQTRLTNLCKAGLPRLAA
jgi:hypothetical protein